MGKLLSEIATELKGRQKKVQLIYAFNGVGKTRLSREFKELVSPKGKGEDKEDTIKIVYYSAFTEDLFHWDNDLQGDNKRRLLIQPNNFTKWIFEVQGDEKEIVSSFQHYTSKSLTPIFSPDYSQVTFSILQHDGETLDHVKISKGEESCFIWSIFYSFFREILEVRNIIEEENRSTRDFDQLEYVFIDDPVSSLDENHLIELAVDIASLIRADKSDLRFIITTHNPLFYNILWNEFNNAYRALLEKIEDGSYRLKPQNDDSPFSYHLFLLSKIEEAVDSGEIHKYHFAFLRNILEKTSTFLGYAKWKELLPQTSQEAYFSRIINLANHGKHSGDETIQLPDNDKKVLGFLLQELKKEYKFK